MPRPGIVPCRAFLLLITLTFGRSAICDAQSGKSFFKEGESLRAEQRLDEALEKYGLAIRVDPAYVKAYGSRAEVYTLLGQKANAAADLAKVAELQPNDASAAAKAALSYLDAGDPDAAAKWADKAVQAGPKDLDALTAQVRVALVQGDLDKATEASDRALDVKGTTDTYYLHGLVRTALRDYRTAESDLQKVIEWNYTYEDAYVALAEVQLRLYATYEGPTMQLRTLDQAVERTTTALELDPRSMPALFTRSKAYALQKEYAKAIEDISKVVALGRNDAEVYRQRAVYYKDYGQFQNAINDLNRVLEQLPEDRDAMLERVRCKEANLDLDGALADLDRTKKMAEQDTTATYEDRKAIAAERDRIAQRVFEMNRESDPPLITVVEPFRQGDVVQVSSVLDQVKVTGHVRDHSLIKAITVNDKPAEFSEEDKDPEFFVVVPLGPKADKIEVVVKDIYDNVASVELHVERSEGVPPVVSITSPTIGSDRSLMIDADRDEVFLEGHAQDASLLRSVTVEGVMASFVPDTNATDFSIKLPVSGKDRFTVRVEDQYGNAAEETYFIARRRPEPVAASTPTRAATASGDATATNAPSATGVTWVVFIENTDYKYMPALQGPTNEVSKMQKSFAKYSIQRTITKRNLTKDQIERFFNSELRDLVRRDRVNTILVWYAGHGRTASGKSYWVPVDGKQDDIYTYYNYGSLKSLMQNYSESVTNTLVVSDAAGSDPSFYELTR
ncbi:MAG: tetratricopeptide repeat protein [Flavobacteriales bacterium]|nr:tetratricopeptide repeat protein [Flavobacteriales bacterium]